MPSTTKIVEALSLDGQATDHLQLRVGLTKFFDVSIKGVFVSTLILQRKRPDEDDSQFRTYKTYTRHVEEMITMAGSWDCRIITENHFTGTALIDMGI